MCELVVYRNSIIIDLSHSFLSLHLPRVLPATCNTTASSVFEVLMRALDKIVWHILMIFGVYGSTYLHLIIWLILLTNSLSSFHLRQRWCSAPPPRGLLLTDSPEGPPETPFQGPLSIRHVATLFSFLPPEIVGGPGPPRQCLYGFNMAMSPNQSPYQVIPRHRLPK